MPVAGRRTIGCRCCGCCRCLNNIILPPPPVTRTVRVKDIILGDSITVNDFIFIAGLEDTDTTFSIIPPAGWTVDQASASTLADLIKAIVPNVSASNKDKTVDIVLTTSLDEIIIAADGGFIVGAQPPQPLGRGNYLLMPNIRFDANAVGIGQTIIRHPWNDTDAALLTDIWTDPFVHKMNLHIPMKGKPRLLYLPGGQADIVEEDFDSLGERKGVLFECCSSLTIDLVDMLPKQTIKIEGVTFTADASTTNTAEGRFSVAGIDDFDAVELAKCIDAKLTGVTTSVKRNRVIIHPNDCCRHLTADFSSFVNVKRGLPSFFIKSKDTLVGQWVKINDIKYIGIDGLADIPEHKFNAGPTDGNTISQLRECINGISDMTLIQSYQAFADGSSDPHDPGPNVLGIQPFDGQATPIVKTGLDSIILTLDAVRAEQTVTINGIIFTAHPTATDTTKREFKISAASDAVDALELLRCITDATHGVTDVIAFAGGSGGIFFAPKPNTGAVVVTPGASTFTITPSTIADWPGIQIIKTRQTATIDLTHIPIGLTISINGLVFEAADENDSASRKFDVTTDDNNVAINLLNCINSQETLQVIASVKTNRVTLNPSLPTIAVTVLIPDHSATIRNEVWKLLESNGPVGFADKPEYAAVDGVASVPLFAATVPETVVAPRKVWCSPSYTPGAIELVLDGWHDENQGDNNIYTRSNINKIAIAVPITGNTTAAGRRNLLYRRGIFGFGNPGLITIQNGNVNKQAWLAWEVTGFVQTEDVDTGAADQITIVIRERRTVESFPGSGVWDFDLRPDGFHPLGTTHMFSWCATWDRLDDANHLTHWIKIRNAYSGVVGPWLGGSYDTTVSGSPSGQPIGNIISL